MSGDNFIKYLRNTDPALLSLPSPVRMRLCEIGAMIEEILGAEGCRQFHALMDQGTPYEVTLNMMRDNPAIAEFLKMAPTISGTTNYGALDAFMAPMMHEAHGRAHIQTSDNFEQMLRSTDLGREVLARHLHVHQKSVFVEFGETRNSPLRIHNRESGEHILEGVYVVESDIPPGHFMVTHHPSRSAGLALSSDKPTRIVELTLTGSPLGKNGLFDDATQRMPLFIQDEEEPLRDVLDRHYHYYSQQAAFPQGGETMSSAEIESCTAAIEHLAKTLIILNTQPCIEDKPARRDLEQKIGAVGPKKRAKYERKLPFAYDRRVLRPSAELDRKMSAMGVAEQRRAHWRRGHFRMQPCGPGKMDRKLIYIEATFVSGTPHETAE